MALPEAGRVQQSAATCNQLMEEQTGGPQESDRVSVGQMQCGMSGCPHTAMKACLTCGDSYCMTCIKPHYENPDLQRHELQNLRHQDRCEQHKKKLKFYCKTDHSAVCSRCAFHNHKGHDVIELEDIDTDQDMMKQSKTTKQGVVPPPGQLEFSSVTADSVTVSWSPPEGDPGSYRYRVSWKQGQEQQKMEVEGSKLQVMELLPGEKYHFTVATLTEHGHYSTCVERSVYTEVPMPEDLIVDFSCDTLKWTKPKGVDQVSYKLEFFNKSDGKTIKNMHMKCANCSISELQHGHEYTVYVTTLINGCQSKPIIKSFTRDIPVPECLTVSCTTASSASLNWEAPPKMEQTPHSFLVSYQSEGTEPKSISTESCSVVITDLKPGTQYTVRVCTELQHGVWSKPASVQIKTVVLCDMLSALNLEKYKEEKLTLCLVLEVNRNTISDDPPQSLGQLPWNFLKKLITLDLTSRNITSTKRQKDILDEVRSKFGCCHFDAINPLDLITALFHCSDPFLQQEMVSKMAMCQFAVPLLLPNCDTQQSTLMLWAMRDVVKIYRPHSLTGDRTYVEGRVVEMDIPLVSFVRLGKSSLHKSQILNTLISNPHQHIDTFFHHDMKCGDVPRRISDGLVEISWCLPCGKTSIDMFQQPIAMANLRGDGRLLKTQMSFLCQTSAAVFIFCDDLEGDLSIPTNRKNNVELFMVTNSQKKMSNKETFVDICKKYNITNVISRKDQNYSEFIQTLRHHVIVTTKKNPAMTGVKKMASVAQQLGFVVDEHCRECSNGKQNAEKVISNIDNVMEFKESQLPLHGKLWKDISQLEKERCRLRNVNREKDIEHYKSDLNIKQTALREKQCTTKMSDSMKNFIDGISHSDTERFYFLKWLKILLDDLSRCNLATLRQQYKQCKTNTPQNKDLPQLDEQISKSSFGLEHFFRELGQLYESACYFPETHPARKRVQDLPALCAQMLLDGFPIELVDGDSSNIPMKWISEIMTQLHKKVDSKSRILVLTVLGVQGTGKSTLLNTMFGVQFAVSCGRCTKGAFMQLMKVSEDFRSELKCDFIMLIDTEGLKSPELAELDTSHEHDNELATLVIGLSDITIINVAMENNIEMRDILQIVIHAFLRMKAVGKKPRCVFVHQNVSDMAANDLNMRDRRRMVEQLDEMTKIAAKMEKMEAYTKFSDVMIYDPDTDSYYIPGLWHGTPPMAPVNAGYSEAVYELKRRLLDCVQRSDNFKCNDAAEFLTWTENLWNAVKFENFIFNFRNSLMAVAYTDLCTEYNKWEWSFRKEMNEWLTHKETMLSNNALFERNVQMNTLQEKINVALKEASDQLNEKVKRILSNLDQYFEKNDNKVSLVEKYRQDFQTSASSLKQELGNSIKLSLQRVVEIQEGMEKVKEIKVKQIDTIETKIRELLKDCRNNKTDVSDDKLKSEFEKMWGVIMADLSVKMPSKDVYDDSYHLLKTNLSSKSGHVSEMISTVKLTSSGLGKFCVKSEWLSDLFSSARTVWGVIKHRDINYFLDKMQGICEGIIKLCVDTAVQRKTSMERNNIDYHEAYIREILNIIDEELTNHQIPDKCEAELKFYICGHAARIFQEEHNKFNERNDPHNHLEECRETFQQKFLDIFHEKDQCQKKVKYFIEKFVKPAVQDYVSKHLGQAIADEMKCGDGGADYSTQPKFQFALLKWLLEENSFENYKEHTSSSETFVTKWIKQRIVGKMTKCGKMATLQKNLLSEIIKDINYAITKTSKKGDLKDFIKEFCSKTVDKLVFPHDVLPTFLSLDETKAQEFSSQLTGCVNDMEISLANQYDKTDHKHIFRTIHDLPSKPHELLYTSLYGCGEQCPFCGALCEAGGKKHAEHLSSMHRPTAFGSYRFSDSQKLATNICTSLVVSPEKRWFNIKLFDFLFGPRFQNDKTQGKSYPFKKYRDIYPDWDIKGDCSLDASNYWKYVLNKFNKEFAEAYDALPADIPEDWKRITVEDALKSLEKSFMEQ